MPKHLKLFAGSFNSSLKTIAIHQPNFFPWLGYFYKIAHCDTFVILDNVDFQQGNHNSITNRTKIKCNGLEKFFTVSVKKSDAGKLISDIKIDRNSTNIKKQLKTIQFNYTKAAYYKEIYPFVEKLLLDFETIEGMSEANTFVINAVCELLGITTPVIKASGIALKEEDRNERIIEICKKLDGTHYFSGNGAKKYHNEQLFLENNISIKYTDFKAPVYGQVGTEFISGLSTLDVLMNCGIEGTKNFIE